MKYINEYNQFNQDISNENEFLSLFRRCTIFTDSEVSEIKNILDNYYLEIKVERYSKSNINFDNEQRETITCVVKNKIFYINSIGDEYYLLDTRISSLYEKKVFKCDSIQGLKILLEDLLKEYKK